MERKPYEPADRRPIASRERKIWQTLAALLAGCRVSPNAISLAGMVAGVLAGGLLAATSCAAGGWLERGLWLAAAAAIQLRLLANMLDGMVAIATGTASPLGELYNEIPDRVSDVGIILGAGYAAGGLPGLGWAAACIAIVTAYIRAVGKAAGASDLFVGPMAKPHRMFVLTLVALAMAVLPPDWQPRLGPAGNVGLPSLGLAILILGGLWTVARRLARIVRHLKATA